MFRLYLSDCYRQKLANQCKLSWSCVTKLLFDRWCKYGFNLDLRLTWFKPAVHYNLRWYEFTKLAYSGVQCIQMSFVFQPQFNDVYGFNTILTIEDERTLFRFNLCVFTYNSRESIPWNKVKYTINKLNFLQRVSFFVFFLFNSLHWKKYEWNVAYS